MTRPIAQAASLSFLLLSVGCGDSGVTSATEGGLSTITSATTPPPTGTSEDAPTGGASTLSESTGESGSGGVTGSTGATGDTSTGAVADTTTTTTAATTTTGDTTAAATTGTTSIPVEPCDIGKTTVSPIPPYILLVLDKSGSMSEELWDHDDKVQTPTVTRWYSLVQVVEGVLNNFDKVVNFGLKLYPKLDAGPYIDEGACIVNPGVEVPIAPMNAAAVLSVVPDANILVKGGTPMETGLKEAFKYLKTIDPGEQRFALMIADGEISNPCMGESFFEALATVEDAYEQHDIATYVVGIDVDADTASQLTALAEAGGKPKPGPEPFYQTTNQDELKAAIQQIIDDTLSCVITVEAPSQPELFEVHIAGEKYPEVADCAGGDGWVWTAKHTEIELCGDACAALKATGEVETLYFCTAG